MNQPEWVAESASLASLRLVLIRAGTSHNVRTDQIQRGQRDRLLNLHRDARRSEFS
jgi:hypothetical protein